MEWNKGKWKALGESKIRGGYTKMTEDVEKKSLGDIFREMCINDPKEACLFALSRIAMRHLSKGYEQELSEVANVLDSIETDDVGINKTKDILGLVRKYDESLIKYLSECEMGVAIKLQKSYGNDACCSNASEREEEEKSLVIEEQRKNIKKWWE
jgi:hypothetical protein